MGGLLLDFQHAHSHLNITLRLPSTLYPKTDSLRLEQALSQAPLQPRVIQTVLQLLSSSAFQSCTVSQGFLTHQGHLCVGLRVLMCTRSICV